MTIFAYTGPLQQVIQALDVDVEYPGMSRVGICMIIVIPQSNRDNLGEVCHPTVKAVAQRLKIEYLVCLPVWIAMRCP